LQVSAPNIILSAFKRSQDQTGWIARFYEANGKTTEVDINISANLMQIENIWECDLMESKNTLSPLKVIFQPYEIKTFFITAH